MVERQQAARVEQVGHDEGPGPKPDQRSLFVVVVHVHPRRVGHRAGRPAIDDGVQSAAHRVRRIGFQIDRFQVQSARLQPPQCITAVRRRQRQQVGADAGKHVLQRAHADKGAGHRRVGLESAGVPGDEAPRQHTVRVLGALRLPVGVEVVEQQRHKTQQKASLVHQTVDVDSLDAILG